MPPTKKLASWQFVILRYDKIFTHRMCETVSEKIQQNFIVKSSPNRFLARNPPNRQASVEKQWAWVVFYSRLGKGLYSQDSISFLG